MEEEDRKKKQRGSYIKEIMQEYVSRTQEFAKKQIDPIQGTLVWNLRTIKNKKKALKTSRMKKKREATIKRINIFWPQSEELEEGELEMK